MPSEEVYIDRRGMRRVWWQTQWRVEVISQLTGLTPEAVIDLAVRSYYARVVAALKAQDPEGLVRDLPARPGRGPA